MDNPAPHKDQNLDSRLAEELGDDFLVKALLSYRDEARQESHVSDDQSRKLWERITKSTTGLNVKRLTSVRIVRRWAAGIAACVAFAVGLYSWFDADEEYLLATSSSTIETVTLDDGSSVALRPHSSLFVVDLDNHRYRLEGEALFEVTHNPDREFVVETEFASVSVLGTIFEVSTWANETNVFLASGKVRVDHMLSEESLTLEPGQAAVVDQSTVSRILSDSADETYLDWLNSELLFDRSPAYRVAAELGHHFGGTLVIPDDLAKETLSGRILLTSLDQGLDDLSTVLGGRFDPNGGSSFVLVPD